MARTVATLLHIEEDKYHPDTAVLKFKLALAALSLVRTIDSDELQLQINEFWQLVEASSYTDDPTYAHYAAKNMPASVNLEKQEIENILNSTPPDKWFSSAYRQVLDNSWPEFQDAAPSSSIESDDDTQSIRNAA